MEKKSFTVDRFEVNAVLDQLALQSNSCNKSLNKIANILNAIDLFEETLKQEIAELKAEGLTDTECLAVYRQVMRACNRSIDHYRDLV
jgi:hypothetical protein